MKPGYYGIVKRDDSSWLNYRLRDLRETLRFARKHRRIGNLISIGFRKKTHDPFTVGWSYNHGSDCVYQWNMQAPQSVHDLYLRK